MKWLVPALVLAFAGTASAEDYKRIVSAGGDITEIIVALGAGDRLVGVDSTSGYPKEVKALDSIGYVRRLAAEGLLSLTPDLLIGAGDAGPPVVLEQLDAAGVKVALAPEGSDVASVTAKIAFVGKVLGLETEAADMVARHAADMEKIAGAIAGVTTRPRVLFVLSVVDGAPLVGGTNTSADTMITLAGGENVAAGFEGYKPMNREAILAAAPDLVLMTDAHAGRLGGIEQVLARPEISLTPAGQNDAAVMMPAMLLLGLGPRTAEGVRLLARELHPEDAGKLGL